MCSFLIIIIHLHEEIPINVRFGDDIPGFICSLHEYLYYNIANVSSLSSLTIHMAYISYTMVLTILQIYW